MLPPALIVFFFTKCEQEKKSLLYLKVKDGTFKCVTTALLHKQKSDSSQDALKMSQNISIVPVKHSFLMYDMQKAKIKQKYRFRKGMKLN